MALTVFQALNLPENGTAAELRLTLCQNGTEPEEVVKHLLDAM